MAAAVDGLVGTLRHGVHRPASRHLAGFDLARAAVEPLIFGRLQHPSPPVQIFDEQGSKLPVGEDYSFTYYPQEHGLLIAVWTEDGRDVASLIQFTDLDGHVLNLREIPRQPQTS